MFGGRVKGFTVNLFLSSVVLHLHHKFRYFLKGIVAIVALRYFQQIFFQFLHVFPGGELTERFSNSVELGGEDDFVGLGETLNEVDGFNQAGDSDQPVEEIVGQRRFETFFLEKFHNVEKYLVLVLLGPSGGEVESDVFVDPHPALAVPVDEDHPAGDVEGAETVNQPLETDQRLLHEVEHLEQRHPGQRLQVLREALDGHLHHGTLIQQFSLQNFVEEDLHDGEFRFGPPLDQLHLALEALVFDNHLVLLEVLRGDRGYEGFSGVRRKF